MEKKLTEVYWSKLIHKTFQNQPLYLAATQKGLCRISWPNESFETLKKWIEKQIPNAVLIEESGALSPYIEQISEYLESRRREFSVSLDLYGTPFQISVWRALAQIPYGQTRSYSQIAESVRRPKAVRAVGAANGNNPVPIILPCHRVIGKNTVLTGFRGGLQLKETLLKLEGFHEYIPGGHKRFQF